MKRFFVTSAALLAALACVYVMTLGIHDLQLKRRNERIGKCLSCRQGMPKGDVLEKFDGQAERITDHLYLLPGGKRIREHEVLLGAVFMDGILIHSVDIKFTSDPYEHLKSFLGRYMIREDLLDPASLREMLQGKCLDDFIVKGDVVERDCGWFIASVPSGGAALEYPVCYAAKVIIKEGTTSIPPRAFAGWPFLAEVQIPDSVTDIGEAAFQNCRKLTKVTLPPNVVEVRKETFQGCHWLAEVSLPAAVRFIGDGAFQGCSRLQWVNIASDSTLQGIGEKSFYGCYSMTDLSLPATLSKISRGAFAQCPNLVPPNVPNGKCVISPRAFDHPQIGK